MVEDKKGLETNIIPEQQVTEGERRYIQKQVALNVFSFVYLPLPHSYYSFFVNKDIVKRGQRGGKC